MPRVWDTWLPPDVVHEVEGDRSRFSVLASCVAKAVAEAQNRAASNPDAWHALVIPWIPILNNYMQSWTLVDPEDVKTVVQALWTVVLNSSHDLEVQVRCSDACVETMRAHKKLLLGSLVLPWKPLYEMLIAQFDDPAPRLEGYGLTSARQNSLLALATKSRRLFAPEAAEEIWATFGPCIHSSDVTESYMAVCWLVLLLPTFDFCFSSASDLNARLAEWMRCWGMVSGCAHWDSLWMRLFARAAKHDSTGRIQWSPHLSQLFTYMMGVFEVPVGNATGASPVARSPPHKPVLIFATLMSGEAFNIAVCIVHMLRSPQGEGQGFSAGATQTLSNFLHMVNLLEQYFHPSNTGKWSTCLSELLRELVSIFLNQLAIQASPPPATSTAAIATPSARAVLSAEVQMQLVGAGLKLAARGQFSKNSSLARTSCRALAQLAFISPTTVLPLVVRRFRSSLETSTATHQLANSISTMALCVRPMLLSGWCPEEETGEAMLAEAMMALLPGIDANDETKTSAVLHFYTMVLSSVPSLGASNDSDNGGGGVGAQAADASTSLCLPLYVEEWAEELLNRLLSLLQNLDTGPGLRADQASGKGEGGGGGSFLTNSSNGMLMHLCDLLFQKLPREVCEGLIKRLSEFSLSCVLPAVVQEVCTICGQAAQYHPAAVMKLLVKPLLKCIKAELPESGSAPSQSLESTLCFQLGVLHQLLGRYKGDDLLLILKEVEALVDASMSVPSRPVQARGASLLSSLSFALVLTFDRPPPLSAAPCGPHGVELWVDKEGLGFQPPRWTPPSAAELAAAEDMVQRHLLGSCTELVELCAAQDGQVSGDGGSVVSDSSHVHKMKLNALITKIRGMLSGLMSHLRDFEFGACTAMADTGGSSDSVPLGIVGCQGTFVGPPKIREAVAGKLAQACRLLSNQDPDILSAVMSACGLLLCNGFVEYSRSSNVRSQVARLIELLAEPPVVGVQLAAASGAVALSAGGPHMKRVPRWLAEMRVGLNVQWRSSQAAFRGWTTSSCPSLSDLPPAYCALVAEICTLSMHRYSGVRDGALPIMDACCKRFPLLVKSAMPTFLAGMADVKSPELLHMLSDKQAVATEEASFFSRLSAAATDGPSPAAVAAEAEDASSGAAGTESERDGRVLGSCRMFQGCLSFWRAIFRQRTLFFGMLHAAMASRAYPGVKAQAQLGNLLVQMTARFVHPPSMDFSSSEYAEQAEQVLALARPGAAATRGGGRYSLIANVLALLTMPPEQSQPSTLPFTRHLLELMDSDLLPLRQLAATGVCFQLSCVAEYGQVNTGIVDAVGSWLSAKGCGERLMSHMVLAHTKLDQAEASRDKKGTSQMMSMNFEEMITRVVTASLQNTLMWPADASRPAAITAGLFVVQHAKLLELLCRIAPQQALSTLRAPLEAQVTPELCVKISNTSEKAELAACAEVLAGLLASGSAVSTDDSSASGASDTTAPSAAWVYALLDVALRSTTLELAGSWALSVRYGLKGLLEAAKLSRLPANVLYASLPSPPTRPHTLSIVPMPQALGSLSSLLKLLLGGQTLGGAHAHLPAGVGAELPSSLKRIKYLHSCVGELRGYRSCHADTPSEVRMFWAAVLDELKRMLATDDAFSLREQLGALLADVLSFFGTDSGPSLQAAANAGAVGDESHSTTTTNSPVMVEACAADEMSEPSGLSTPVEIEMMDNESAVLLLHNSVTQLRQQAHQLALMLATDFAAATRKVAASRTADLSTKPPSSDDAVMEDASLAGAPPPPGAEAGCAAAADDALSSEVSQLGVGLQFIVCGLKHGNLVSLRELLVAMLPQLFSLQELAGPALQKLAHEAQLAFVMVKYLDLSAANVSAVVTATSATSKTELWSSRAAGLLYLQYVWWRQCFLMSSALTCKLKDVVVGRLSDSKAEVRHIAAATLSGMIKGMADEEAAALRSSMLGSARASLGGGGVRKRSKAAAAAPPNATTLLEKQGIVQGLKAFLLSSPYDCPPWVPEVLLALFPAAGSGQASPQLRADASKALSEFKRTHEQDSIDELRAMLDSDQWDTYQEATSSASYFA